MNETYELIRYWKCLDCDFDQVHENEGEWKCNRCKSNNILLKDHELKLIQPERLNPEDIRNNVCDSPTSENK